MSREEIAGERVTVLYSGGMKPLPVVLGKQKKCLMNLLEVAKEVSRWNVESTSKFFLAVNDKVLQEKGTKEGTIQFANSEGKIIDRNGLLPKKISPVVT